jgi:hypothetical protein
MASNEEQVPLTSGDVSTIHTQTHKVEVQYGATVSNYAPGGGHGGNGHIERVLTRNGSSSSFMDSVRSSTREILRSSQRSLSRRCSVTDSGGTATIADEVFNLTKNIVGSVSS